MPFAPFGTFGESDAYLPIGKDESALYMLVDPRDETVRYIGRGQEPKNEALRPRPSVLCVQAWCGNGMQT